jgi:alpha-1,6-mannosyltransferase
MKASPPAAPARPEITSTGPLRRRATVATAATVVTSIVVALVASVPESPFTPPLARGAEAPRILAGPASALGLDRLARDVAGVVGTVVLVAAAAAFVFALREVWRGRLSLRLVLLVGVALHALALITPLFLSRDVYSYAIYGRMVSLHGLNPYTSIPAAAWRDPFNTQDLVSVDWIDSPAVYGPAFSAISAGVTGAIRGVPQTVFAFKALAAAASLATMFAAVAAARRVAPERAAFAGAIIGWNPVILFHGVAGGHNDTLVGLAVAVGVLLILARRDYWATAVLTLGTLVKISGAIPLVIAVIGSTLWRPRGQRLRAFGTHMGIGLIVGLPFILPFMQLEDPTLGTLELANRQGWLAPPRLVLVVVRGIVNHTIGFTAGDIAGVLVRMAFPVLLVLVMWAILRHLARGGSSSEPVVVVGGMGWASLISLMVAPILLPWYAAWVVPFAWALPRSARNGTVLTAVALTITELVAEPSRAPRVWEVMVFSLHWVATPIVLAVLIYLLVDLRRRLRRPPAPGWLDPLLAEGAGIPAQNDGRGRFARAVVRGAGWIGLGPPRHEIADGARGPDRR